MSKPSRSLRSILIGTSLSAESDPVVETGVALARASGATAHLVHAYSPPPVFAGATAECSAASEWWDIQRQDLEARLAAQARRCGLDEVGGTAALEVGAPYQVLYETSGTLLADLIVVGTQEEDRRWPRLGSTADRLIRKVHCPVLAVRPGSDFPPERVLAPVDFSLAAGSTLTRGLEVLAQGQGKMPQGSMPDLAALFVLNPLEQAGSLQFTPEQIARFAADELDRFVDTHVPAAFGSRQCRVRTGYPAEEILSELKEGKVDLVILGTHGRSGLERMLIGSVAADVLQSAPCSVLIVPPDPEAVQAPAEADRRGADWAHIPDEIAAHAM